MNPEKGPFQKTFPSSSEIRILTVKAPWSQSIFDLGKTLENRPKFYSFQGLLVIHSSKEWSMEGAEFVKTHWDILPKTYPGKYPNVQQFFLQAAANSGKVIGAVQMIGCSQKHFVDKNPWAIGPFCYVLQAPVLFKNPFPLKGQLAPTIPLSPVYQMIKAQYDLAMEAEK